MVKTVVLGAILAAIHAVVVGSGAAVDLAVGLAAGVVIAAATASRRRPGALRARGIPMLAAGVASESATGTATLLRFLVRRGRPRALSLVEVPMGERSRPGVIVTELMVTISPGTIFVDEDLGRRTMTIHSIDAAGPGATRRKLEELYRRYQRPAVP